MRHRVSFVSGVTTREGLADRVKLLYPSFKYTEIHSFAVQVGKQTGKRWEKPFQDEYLPTEYVAMITVGTSDSSF